MQQAFHIFAYIDQVNLSKTVFDFSNSEIPESRFVKADWKDFYLDVDGPASIIALETWVNGAHLH